MTKPLKLTVHPPLSPPVRESVDWNLEHGWEPYTGFGVEENVPGISAMHTKRLTEPELAAEYWRHEGDYRMLTDGYMVESFGVESLVAGPSSEERSRAQLDTLLRFATSPHYCEDDA